MKTALKKLTLEDAELHKEFIYVALWDHPDDERRPRSSLESSAVKAYYENWGAEHDIGYIAYIKDQPAGFIQSRVKDSITAEFSGYPELSIAVFSEYQRKGIASLLYSKIIQEIKDNYQGTRLGVNPKNTAAINLYQKLGFECYSTPTGGYPQMVLHFSND